MALTEIKRLHYLAIDSETGRFSTKRNGVLKGYEAVSGKLLKINRHSHAYEDKFIEKLDLHLQDDDEQYQISFGFETYLAQNVLNLLGSIPANLSEMNLKLSAYKKNGYIKLFALCNNQKLTWRYAPDEIPKEQPEKNEFFEKLYKELKERLEQHAQHADSENENSNYDSVPF